MVELKWTLRIWDSDTYVGFLVRVSQQESASGVWQSFWAALSLYMRITVPPLAGPLRFSSCHLCNPFSVVNTENQLFQFPTSLQLKKSCVLANETKTEISELLGELFCLDKVHHILDIIKWDSYMVHGGTTTISQSWGQICKTLAGD